MATVNDVLAAIAHVKVCTGDPTAWLTGLTPGEVLDVATIFATSPERLEVFVAKIRREHPDLFDPATGAMIFRSTKVPAGPPPGTPPPGAPPSDRQEGEAAEAIRDAESALAHQNSATAQLDLQVITAILNAHLKTVQGKEALNKLQQQIEAAVRTRTDLDTPAGARDFQRFLIGTLRDIRAAVTSANLDDTSKSALMAAWTSLYNASKTGPGDPSEGRPARAAAPSRSAEPSALPDAGLDPYLDSLLVDDPGFLAGDPPPQIPSAPMPTVPAMPGIPNFGAGMMPGGGAVPSSMPGWGMPGGFPLPGLLGTENERSPRDLDDALLTGEDPKDEPSQDGPDGNPPDHDAVKPEEAPELPPAGPTTVTLPNGDTVTAASPQLAAAIKAAAGGTSIPDAFRQQGITIPSPGTAVANPVEPSRLTPGDIGMFTDRHALALGNSKALLNGQIQHISTVKGPSFLGWEHPPAPAAATAPTRTESPIPTRPAARAGTSD
jgi:hypothetical protein